MSSRNWATSLCCLVVLIPITWAQFGQQRESDQHVDQEQVSHSSRRFLGTMLSAILLF